MLTRGPAGRLLSAVTLVACSGSASPESRPAARVDAPIRPAVLSLPAAAGDSAATLDSLQAFARRVDADTARMPVARDQIDLGAGVIGTLTAWRVGPAWQRIHLVAGDSAFTTTDTYWLHDGQPVGARLESRRPGLTPSVEQVWFRDGQLYRWVDAAGRGLTPHAQSTRSEVDRLQSRVSRLLALLAAAPITPVE